MLQITVCGDSPIAHSIVAACGLRGHRVRVLSREPSCWRTRLRCQLPDGSRLVAPIEAVTDDPGAATAGADVVFVCVPHADIESALERIASHLREGMLVGGIPGFGGFGLLARARLLERCLVFGTQRIPFVVSKCERGHGVRIGGIRRQTFVGTLPAQRARPVAELLGQILGVRTVPVSHYLNIELSPSNSIVNPARLYALFGPTASGPPRLEAEFFSDWDLAYSRMLLAVDRELQEARRLIPRDTSFVAPILLQYDANDAYALTDRFRELTALAGRPIPARLGRRGVEMDATTHYLCEDVDFGLSIAHGILQRAGAQTPLIDEILQWRRSLLPARNRRAWHRRRNPAQAFASIDALAAALD